MPGTVGKNNKCSPLKITDNLIFLYIAKGKKVKKIKISKNIKKLKKLIKVHPLIST